MINLIEHKPLMGVDEGCKGGDYSCKITSRIIDGVIMVESIEVLKGEDDVFE